MSRFPAILLSLSLAAVVSPAHAQDTTRVESGDLGGSRFRIQVPARWNHGLVVYEHGYLPRGAEWAPMSRWLAAVFLDRGFAVAEAGFSRQGWAIEEGLRDTEALRRHFTKRYGRPDTVFVTGFSMGATLALATIEAHPREYAGALPMCGPLAASEEFFRDRVLGVLVTFEALFGRNLPPGQRPLLAAGELPEPLVESALAPDSALALRFCAKWDVRREDLASIVSFYHLLYRELADRAGGAPCDNRNAIYAGFGPVAGLNDSVPRSLAMPLAADYLRRFFTPTGGLRGPVLALHTTYDPGVPQHFANVYGGTVSRAGTEAWFVQQRVEADGHCNIKPALVGQAFDELRDWVSGGIRPAPRTLR